MPLVEVSRRVKRPAAAVFEELTDMEKFPSFMSAIEEVTVVGRGEGWTRTRWVAHLRGSTFRWVEEDRFYPEKGLITYKQVEGDLERFEGAWTVVPVENEANVSLTVDFSFGIPMIASILNPVAKVIIRQNVVSMLTGLQERGR